jgi:HD-GYP domain-containing protein (c-di-GMP phosphodiesterase class II)
MNEGYFRIRVKSLKSSLPLSFELFLQLDGRMIHFRRQGDKLEENRLQNLDKLETSVLYIKDTERFAYKDYVHETLSKDTLTTKEKAMVLKESSFSLVEELFEQPDVSRALTESKEIIENFVEFMEQDPQAMAHLIGLSSHDFYTYNHSLDVSIYALGLGMSAGYSSKADLLELGHGALLHDIGKRNVNTEIICKKGPLDETEWAQMKMHPAYGLKLLNDFPGITDAIKACVFEHHENHVGNGYPQNLDGHEIHPMARVVAICDTYDAMTTKRSYNEPMTPTAALELMKSKLAGRFDPDLLHAMYSVLFQMKKAA